MRIASVLVLLLLVTGCFMGPVVGELPRLGQPLAEESRPLVEASRVACWYMDDSQWVRIVALIESARVDGVSLTEVYLVNRRTCAFPSFDICVECWDSITEVVFIAPRLP